MKARRPTTRSLEMALHHSGLVYAWLRSNKRWIPRRLYEDCAQLAFWGLAIACENYKPERGALSTYAWLWMRSTVGRFVARERGHDVWCGAFSGKIWRTRVQFQPDVYDDAIAFSYEIDDDVMMLGPMRRELERMPPRERDVLAAFASGKTMGKIGGDLGVTRQRVDQIFRDGLLRLRKRMRVKVGS